MSKVIRTLRKEGISQPEIDNIVLSNVFMVSLYMVPRILILQ